MKGKKAFIYGLLVLLGVGLFTFLDFRNTAIPYDDAYSVFMIKSSYADIAGITAKDVHPPLYYWGLKTFSYLSGDSMFALRLFSMSGILASLLLGCFPIRKLFGDKVAIFFIVLLIIFPVSQYLATDIRMYSWTMFFVLACALYGYKVYKEGKLQNWTIFLLTGICAAYMHNYGLLSVLGIYIALLVALTVSRKKWLPLLYCGLAFTLLYLPWLLQLLHQVQDVSADYWIKPLTWNDLFLHIYYFYSPKDIWLPFTDFSKSQMMFGLIVIMLIQLVLTYKVLTDGYKQRNIYVFGAIISFLVFIFPVLLGAVVSLLGTPILVTRYMTCSFGLFVLSLAFILAKACEYPSYRKLSCVFLCLLLIDGGARFYSGLKYYNQTEKAYNDIRRFIDNGNQVLVNDFSYHVLPRLQILAPDNEYYVLVRDKKEDFEPFRLKEINSTNFTNFILVHQEREAIQSDFREYWQEIQNDFVVTDSLHASDIYLYKITQTEENDSH